MPELLTMPEVAANTTEATIASWPFAEHERFAARDVIVVVETDKAAVDVQAEADGVILRRLVAEGTEVRVGEPIALVGRPGETVDDVEEALRLLGAPRTDAGPVPEQAAVPAAVPPPDPTPGRLFASPLARRLAKEAGLALGSMTGTGPNGRITRRDVERARTGTPAADPALAEPQVPATSPTPSTPPAVLKPAAGSAVPHSRQRRAIARHLTTSQQTVPHFYVRGSARVDRLLAMRADLNAGGAGVKVSVNDVVVKAVARAHVLEPALNVVWTDDAVVRLTQVDVAVAVATDQGLVTPVLRAVDRTPVSEVALTTQDFGRRAREGRLQQQELEGGGSTVTNLGMFGTEEFAAIINPPQASILAVGAARRRPLVTRKGRFKAGSVMTVTLSADHRPIDGADAARWMAVFLDLLEHPARILA